MSGLNRASINRSPINKEGGGAALLQASLVAVPQATGDLTNLIKLNGPGTFLSVPSFTSPTGLLTAITAAVPLAAAALIVASLTTTIKLAAAPTTVASATSVLTTQVYLNGPSTFKSVPTFTGDPLQIQYRLNAVAAANPVMTGDMKTQAYLQAALVANPQLPSASLIILFNATTFANPTLTANLTATITPSAGMQASSSFPTQTLYISKYIASDMQASSSITAPLTTHIYFNANPYIVPGFDNPEVYISKFIAADMTNAPGMAGSTLMTGKYLNSDMVVSGGFTKAKLTEVWLCDFYVSSDFADATLWTRAKFNAAASSTPSWDADLFTTKPISSTAQGNCTLGGDLSIQYNMVGAIVCSLSWTMALTTRIPVYSSLVANPTLSGGLFAQVLPRANAFAIPAILKADLTVDWGVDLIGMGFTARPGKVAVAVTDAVASGSMVGASTSLVDYYEAYFNNPNNWVINSPNPVFGIYQFVPNVKAFTLNEAMPMVYIGPEDTADAPTTRKNFSKVEYHGTGTALMRVFVDGELVARYVVDDAENPEKTRVLRLPHSVNGYSIRIEMIGYFIVNHIEYSYTLLQGGLNKA